MNTTDVVNQWKSIEQDATAIRNVAGSPVVDDSLLQQVQGGVGRGWVYTVSGECMGFRCDIWNML